MIFSLYFIQFILQMLISIAIIISTFFLNFFLFQVGDHKIILRCHILLSNILDFILNREFPIYISIF
jgi:hypothetical protein